MTANSFTSVSLEPLLALVCIAESAKMLPFLNQRRRFGVNVLKAGQQALSTFFAQPEQPDDAEAALGVRFAGPSPAFHSSKIPHRSRGRRRHRGGAGRVRPEWEYVPRAGRGASAAGMPPLSRRRIAAAGPSSSPRCRGPARSGRARVPAVGPVVRHDPGWHNAVLTFGYVLARAARGGEVSVLDWGGGPGHYYVLARALLPEVELDYHSRDLPRLVALGREVLPEATFHDDDSCLERTYDLVVASDSLQYAREVEAALARLASAAAPWLFVAQLPVAENAAAFVRAAATGRVRLRHRVPGLGAE